MSDTSYWTDERRTQLYFCVVVVLLVIAVLAPLTVNNFFIIYKPSNESSGVWFQRSGAVTAVFALLAITLQTAASRKLVVPGVLADKAKIEVLNRFRWRFAFCENFSFLLTVIGTLIWGYGDVFVTGIVHAICGA